MSRSALASPVVDGVACPDCGDLAHPSATVCEGCGTHLFVRQGSGRPFAVTAVRGCSCGNAGICTRCVLYRLDNGIAL